MWNIVSASKLTQQRQLNNDYLTHKKSLLNTKASVKITPPTQYPFLGNAPKLKLQKQARKYEIERQNELLVNKITYIQEHKQVADSLPIAVTRLKSLNELSINNSYQRINRQNQVICNRLMRTKTHYPYEDLAKRNQYIKKIQKNITQNARNVDSARMLSHRPASAFQSLRPRTPNTSQSAVARAMSAPSNRQPATPRPCKKQLIDMVPFRFEGGQQAI